MTSHEAAALSAALAAIVIYLLPAFNAYSKHHKSRALILACTVLFGWTVIAWILCLAWSMGSSTDDPAPPKAKDSRSCPHCAEQIQKAAKVCRYCGRDVEDRTENASTAG